MAVNMSHSQTVTRASAEREDEQQMRARTGQLMRAILHRIDDIGPEEGVWVYDCSNPFTENVCTWTPAICVGYSMHTRTRIRVGAKIRVDMELLKLFPIYLALSLCRLHRRGIAWTGRQIIKMRRAPRCAACVSVAFGWHTTTHGWNAIHVVHT